MRGESLDALARETGQPASRIAQWRDQVLSGAEQLLRSRAGDPEYEAWQEEKRKLQAKIGEITMANELLEEKIERLGADRPFPWRRSRR